MSSTPSEPIRTGALASRAVVPGTVIAVVGGATVLLSGRLPEGSAPFVAIGCAAAAITGASGAVLKARALAHRGPDAGQRLQIAIFGDFVIQLFAVGITMLALFLAGVKFANLGGFALAFAGVAVGHQIGSATVLARALRNRAGGAGGPRDERSAGEDPEPMQSRPHSHAAPSGIQRR